MEEIKHLKIETATHVFPKFTCMHSFFVRTDMEWGRTRQPRLGELVGASDWTKSRE
jgi:hypothetical protein